MQHSPRLQLLMALQARSLNSCKSSKLWPAMLHQRSQRCQEHTQRPTFLLTCLPIGFLLSANRTRSAARIKKDHPRSRFDSRSRRCQAPIPCRFEIRQGTRVSLDGDVNGCSHTVLESSEPEADRQWSKGIESSTNSLQWWKTQVSAGTDGGLNSQPLQAAKLMAPVPTDASTKAVPDTEPDASAWPQSLIRSYGNAIAGALVCLSSMSQILELEMKGRSAALMLDVEEGVDFSSYMYLFRYSDIFFDIAFVIEWIILASVQRRDFFRSANAFDSFLVAPWCLKFGARLMLTGK